MASLKTTAIIQGVQWAAIAAWNYFEKDTFHQYALQGERPAKGSFLEDREPLYGYWAMATAIILTATAQLENPASIRKVLQYFNGGYISIIIYILAHGYHESNLHSLVWAALNAFFLVIAVYVWHKDEKNSDARVDVGMRNALRWSYGFASLGFIMDVTGKTFDMYLDDSVNTVANLNATRCAALLKIFTIGALIAAAQIEKADQKKMCQYYMLVLLLAVPRIALMQYEMSDEQTTGVLLVISLLVQGITHACYGGSCEKQVIRLYYTFTLFVALVGFLNTQRFLKLTTPTVESLDAGMISVGLRVHIALLYVAVAQMDASSHRKAIQYSLVALGVHAYIVYNIGDVKGAIYIAIWAAVSFFAVYRNELGLASICKSCFKSGTGSDRKSSDRSPSPKRSSGGRSATPSGKKLKKKK